MDQRMENRLKKLKKAVDDDTIIDTFAELVADASDENPRKKQKKLSPRMQKVVDDVMNRIK